MGHGHPGLQILAAGALGLALLGACGGTSEKGSSLPGQAASDEDDAGEASRAREAAQVQAIADAVNEFSPAVHTCWARAAADDLRLEGRVVVSLVVEEEGGRTELVEEDVGDRVLTSCLLDLWSDYDWPEPFAPGDAIVLPPFEFVAPEAQYTVASDHVPVHSLAGDKIQARVVLDEANTGNGAAALTWLTLSDSAEVPLHTHESTELLFVLSGGGTLTGTGGPHEVGPGSAIYIPPGAVHGFRQEGEEPAQVVQLYTPGGPEARFKDPDTGEGTTAHEGTIPRRGPRALVRRAGELEPFVILGGKGDVRILFDEAVSGEKVAYLGAITARPGASIPAHRHSHSSEYLFVLEGQAEMKVGGRDLVVRAGDGVQLPPGVEHSATVSGGEAFKAVQFYGPAGPEQRFKGGAK